MTANHLCIAYGDERSKRAEVMAEILRGQGHELVSYDDPQSFLAAPEPDVYLLGRTLADGTSALELLESLRRTGRSAPVVLLDEKPDFADLRRAVELGATDFLLRPLEVGELARALERAAATRKPKARVEAMPSAHACERSYTIDATTVGRAAREISAFLVNEGVASAHRVRIASTLAEVVDNACRYAYPDRQGSLVVRAEVQRTRVLLVVEDYGTGFDVQRARLERVPPALPGARGSKGAPRLARLNSASSNTGLGRVERLCEEHHVDSGPEGTRVELSFELTPVRFDEEAEALAETDFLDPARARSLIASLRKGQNDLSSVAPAMAMTIGRILGGIDAEIRPRAHK